MKEGFARTVHFKVVLLNHDSRGLIEREIRLLIKFIGLGEQPDDLQPFDTRQFAQVLFEE